MEENPYKSPLPYTSGLGPVVKPPVRAAVVPICCAVLVAYAVAGWAVGLGLLAAERHSEALKLTATYRSLALGAYCLWMSTRFLVGQLRRFRVGFLAAWVIAFFGPFTIMDCGPRFGFRADDLKDYLFFGLAVFAVGIGLDSLRSRITAAPRSETLQHP